MGIAYGIYALGKTHMHSTRSLRSFPNVAFETVPMFVWLTMAAVSRPFNLDQNNNPKQLPSVPTLALSEQCVTAPRRGCVLGG